MFGALRKAYKERFTEESGKIEMRFLENLLMIFKVIAVVSQELKVKEFIQVVFLVSSQSAA